MMFVAFVEGCTQNSSVQCFVGVCLYRRLQRRLSGVYHFGSFIPHKI